VPPQVAGLCIVDFSAAGVTGWFLAERLRNWRPFEATTTQIQLDHRCLTNLLKFLGR